jgi:hypothetical protein
MRNADLPTPPSGAEAKVTAWTSFVADIGTSKVYSVANGGHNDYDGNEVDMLDMEREVPTWFQLLARSPSQNADYYADGTPTSRHTYYGVTFDPFNNRVMLFSGSPYARGAPFLNTIDSYNLGTNTYSPQGYHGVNPLQPYVQVLGMEPPFACAADPATGNVYAVTQSRMWRWNRVTGGGGTVEQLFPSGTSAAGYRSESAFDTTRHRIFFLGGLGVDHYLYSLSGNSWTSAAITGANAADVLGAQQEAMIYVPTLDRYLVRLSAGPGGTVYQIDASTFVATTYPTTGGATIPTLNNLFNKFLYLPRLGGVVLVPSYTGNVWFLRVN